MISASGGVPVEVLVHVGDEMRKGEVLARLDDSDAQQAVAVDKRG